MATLLVSVPAVPCASRRRSSVALSVGLAALSVGVAVFLLGMVLPEPRLHLIDVLASARNQADRAQDAAVRDTTRTPKSLGHFIPVVDRPADPLGPLLTGPEVRSRSGATASSVETALTRGRR